MKKATKLLVFSLVLLGSLTLTACALDKTISEPIKEAVTTPSTPSTPDTPVVPNTSKVVKIITGSDSQFNQTITTESGKTYLLEFKGKADASGTMKIIAQDSSYNWMYNTDIALTSSYGTFSTTLSGINVTSTSLVLNVSNMGTSVYLDDIKLTEVGGNGTNQLQNGYFETGDSAGWGFWNNGTISVIDDTK